MMEEVAIANTVAKAADTLISQGILGALLVVSIAANAFLVWRLVKCWQHQAGYDNAGN